MATSAIARTWFVRLAASWFTLSVRSFQTPPTSFDCAWAAQFALDPDLAGDARDLTCERVQLIDHRVDRVLQFEELALHVYRDLLAQVAIGDGSGDLRDVSHLPGQVSSHQVDVVRELLPHAADFDRDGGGLA